MGTHVPQDCYRDKARTYAEHWGFRPGSAVARLIECIREESRAKYGVDYRLRRIGKNRFVAVPGDRSDFGVDYAVSASESGRFRTKVARFVEGDRQCAPGLY